MQVIINIPKDFKRHFFSDKFEDSLRRITADVATKVYADTSISGNYELELLDMFIKAFKDAMVTIVATDDIHNTDSHFTDKAHDIELSAGYQAYEELCEG